MEIGSGLRDRQPRRRIDARRQLAKTYPFGLASPRQDNFGVAVFSRIPLEDAVVGTYGLYDIPTVDFKIRIGDETCRFIGVHTLPPVNSELEAFAQIARSQHSPLILAGDFNLTPFSPWFGKILSSSGLEDSSLGFGCWPTWMHVIPIDQALISSSLAVVERRIGPAADPITALWS